MSKQLNKHSGNNVTITLAEIHRNDQFGEWSFKEIGFRVNEAHPKFGKTKYNFELIDLPQSSSYRVCWDIAVKMVDKNKSASEIQKILNFMSEKKWITNQMVKPQLG